ncbi:hypothetical protein BBJ28_00020738 [Nothophytophthora sp. Chile5]|nr:hypothetical protein BBJ28_00020738 [Nothophytophthora sp. Chile5]
MLASYVLELHALKLELQSTLARLGGEAALPDPPSPSPSAAASGDSEDEAQQTPSPGTRSTAETAATTPRSEADAGRRGLELPHRDRSGNRHRRDRPITAWNRRQLMQELAEASSRRRELELQLQNDMRQEYDQPRSHNSSRQRDRCHQRRRSVWQEAIVELQQQRAEILRQIATETAADLAAAQNFGQQRNDDSDNGAREGDDEAIASDGGIANEQRESRLPAAVSQGASNTESASQYSIGGVVTLEPLSATPPQAVTSALSSAQGEAASDLSVARVPFRQDPYPRRLYRSPPDALSDVFSLQLKFAETMLKLEKSVQIRDQLLHQDRLPKRNASTRAAAESTRPRPRQPSHHRFAVESGSNSDSSVMYHRSHNHDSDSFSSSAFSFSSLESTSRFRRRVRTGDLGMSRATTAETAAPSSTGTGTNYSPGLEEATGTVPVASASMLPSNPEPAVSSEAVNDQEAEHHSTPTTASSVTTPTTGSDQKSTSSSNKQVRFGDDAYSTPVIARKFNFDNPSIDEDEDADEVKEEETDSVLSFLGGSSVSSAELNDKSFLRAFERFRRELNPSKHFSPGSFSSPTGQTATRTVFAASEGISGPPKATEAVPSIPEEEANNPSMELSEDAAGFAAALQDQDQHASLQELAGLGVAELQERRRQLCLDIQAGSAQLVLNFGATQNANDAERTKNRLLALRRLLQAIDQRLAES